jgi:hypothetical protein
MGRNAAEVCEGNTTPAAFHPFHGDSYPAIPTRRQSASHAPYNALCAYQNT